MVDVESVCQHLAAAGVAGIDGFRAKLISNRGWAPVFQDLLFEASTALMFARAHCSVSMRESPDLEVTMGAHRFFAEVKHFRRKRQDDIDDQQLSEASSLLVPYGDTVPSEGSAAWDQVAAVACKKVLQYRPGVPNVLVINSSSANCIDEVIIPTAIDKIDEICRTTPNHGLRKLNGIMLVSEEVNISRGGRNVHFFEGSRSAVLLPDEVRAMLNGMALWFGDDRFSKGTGSACPSVA
jgi:hypothetical protein